MSNTEHNSCKIIAALLAQHQIKHAVISPGSRNAPLVTAISQIDAINKTVVIDERSAAFIAMGISSITEEPTVLVCTSGTALLNYAPAIAEAFYRRLPLIIISADRPEEWIDQDDSQTLRQYEALSNYVKKSYNIPCRCNDDNAKWYVNRLVNDAILTATSFRKSPVHINLQLDEPLNKISNVVQDERLIKMMTPCEKLNENEISELCHEINNAHKVLIISGFNTPNSELNTLLDNLSQHDNIVIMSENIANIHGNNIITNIDSVLSIMSEDEKTQLAPDIVITLGGALVSRFIKKYLREYRPKQHWHVDLSNTTIDCFKSLTLRIEQNPVSFFAQISGIVKNNSASNYKRDFKQLSLKSTILHDKYIGNIEWSELKAFSIFMDMIPENWNIQFSNGTSIRYSQFFNLKYHNRCDCNRGVSGIDGSTSTAIGAAMVHDKTTLLITGDMSAQYDIGALATKNIPYNFKMIVMCNGGGGIFRFVNSTANLPELNDYFVVGTNLPLRQLCEGYGFNYYEADNENSLINVFQTFATDNSRPAILALNVPGVTSTEILRNYFNRN